MLKHYLTIVIILICTTSFGQSKLIGKWKGKSANGQKGWIEFRADSTMESMDQSEGMISYYKTDETKIPHHIEIKVISYKNDYEYKMYGLFEFIDGGQLKLEFFKNVNKEEMPNKFSNKKIETVGNIIILNKVKKNKIIGKWQGTSERGDLIEMEFKADSSMFGTGMIKGKDNSSYFVDEIKNPHHIDLFMEARGYKQNAIGIYKFINKDKIKLEYHPEDGVTPRIKKFSNEEDKSIHACIIMERVKDKEE